MSLCYNPTANTITVNIIKARNLKAMDIGGTSGKDLPLFAQSSLCLTLVRRCEAFLVTLEAQWRHTGPRLRVQTRTDLPVWRTVAVHRR